MPKLVIASTNKNKYRELAEVFASLPVSIISPSEVRGTSCDVPDVDETADTYRGNALLKVQAFVEWSGLPAIADDSGLEVDCLEGRPGIYSARLAPTDRERNQKLLKLISDTEESKRTARFRTYLIYRHPSGTMVEAEGILDGTIIEQPRGERGWGYEPLFVPTGESRTIAELRDNGITPDTHRLRAARLLRDQLALLLVNGDDPLRKKQD